MSLHRSSFLPTNCNEDHQATLHERGTYFLALFTKLKQKLQIHKMSQKVMNQKHELLH